MQFTSDGESLDLPIDHAIVAGWTGRNRESVDHHIQELAELGIAPPSTVPLYYRVSSNLLTQASSIEVLGSGTSGEVEPLLIRQSGKIWIGLSSDHTDRELEAHSVAASKQACPKPVATELWSYDSVRDHIDDLLLKCLIKENNDWIAYQEGSLANICPLTELMEQSEFNDGSTMLCGTLPAIGGVRRALAYQMELHDPVLKRTLRMQYTVTELPVVA